MSLQNVSVDVKHDTKKPTMEALAVTAVRENKSRKGMSRQAIHKAIVEGFGGKDGPQFKSVERRMFDHAVEKEMLVKLGGCFKLGKDAKVNKIGKGKVVKGLKTKSLNGQNALKVRPLKKTVKKCVPAGEKKSSAMEIVVRRSTKKERVVEKRSVSSIVKAPPKKVMKKVRIMKEAKQTPKATKIVRKQTPMYTKVMK
eukprot:Selendium_serpulae@DN9533_c0_g1_i1.p2